MTTPTFDKISREPAFQEMFQAGHRRRLVKNQIVLAEGETPRCLYFILSGSVAVRLSNWHGHEVLLAYMHAGDFFGEMCLFPGMPSRSAMVRTLDECMVLELNYQRFLELSAKHSSLWLELAGQIAARLRAVNRRLAEMPVLPAAERIWSTLLELAERADTPAGAVSITLRIKRDDLGKLAGCSREMAGLVLQDFEKAGRVKLDGHRILLPARGAAAKAPAALPASPDSAPPASGAPRR